jgi:hypothetical protein
MDFVSRSSEVAGPVTCINVKFSGALEQDRVIASSSLDQACNWLALMAGPTWQQKALITSVNFETLTYVNIANCCNAQSAVSTRQ